MSAGQPFAGHPSRTVKDTLILLLFAALILAISIGVLVYPRRVESSLRHKVQSYLMNQNLDGAVVQIDGRIVRVVQAEHRTAQQTEAIRGIARLSGVLAVVESDPKKSAQRLPRSPTAPSNAQSSASAPVTETVIRSSSTGWASSRIDSDAADMLSAQLSRLLSEEKIEFNLGASKLTPKGAKTVHKVAALLIDHPNLTVQVAGHTDNSGPAARNRDLSHARAASVVAALVRKGVSPQNLKAVGFGSERPLDDNDTPQGRARNRRIEFVIIEEHQQ